MTTRTLHEIGSEIIRNWENPPAYAVPYIDALVWLRTVDDYYGCESAEDIIYRFLANAGTWRGETARRVKKELREMVKS